MALFDLVNESNPAPFRPGMSANADIQTNTHANVLAVPINAVTTRDRSDTAAVGQETKKEKVKEEKSADKSDEEKPTRDVDALDEVVFVLQKDGTVKRIKVSTAIQDLNYIEVTEGIKAGDEVITGPYSTVSKTLRTGLKVKVVPKEQLFEVKK